MPLDLRKSYVDCAFGQLHLTQTQNNTRQTDKAIMLLNSRPRSLLKLANYLEGYGTCLIVDIPGMGLSAGPPVGASMADIAGAVVQALESAQLDTVDIFGLHSGHKVAAAIADIYPHRVNRLIIAGKTHSIISDRTLRNTAMAAHVARRPADVAIVTYEGRYIDDASQQEGFENIFKANYNFDFHSALQRTQAETLILEISSAFEDATYGRQGQHLVDNMTRAKYICLEEIDVTGLELYVGADRLAKVVSDFLG